MKDKEGEQLEKQNEICSNSERTNFIKSGYDNFFEIDKILENIKIRPNNTFSR